eukprot:m.73515 g.73515  ORF g.73515 m.73515 type:complete len:695 (+) comp13038_c1_seq1:54-2138(+)
MAEASKMMTMMRLGELSCFDEEQRIAIMDLVKDGVLSIDEALAEVKRSKPKTFALKYHGSVAVAAPTLRPVLTPDQGHRTLAEAMDRFKKMKEERKVAVTVSTVGIRIVDPKLEVTLENEPLALIAFFAAVPTDKKKVAYITSYTKLGLVYCHLFSCSKPAGVAEILETIADRKLLASQHRSMVPATGIEKMSAGLDQEDEEDESGVPVAAFHLTYLGCSLASGLEGPEVIREAVGAITEALGKSKDKGKTREVPVVLVVSSEGIRTVDLRARDVVHSVVIKAISYSTEVATKKADLFTFIEVDDRRDTKTCHAFACEQRGQAPRVIEALGEGLRRAVEEAKARAGNPFLAQGRERDRIEGPLADCQVKRTELRAIKIVGAGQFGKVFLAIQTSAQGTTQRAVKMLRSGASAQDREEFLREAETMLALGSADHVVGLVGVAVRQRPWLAVIELCQYGDLADVLHALDRKKIQLTLHEMLRVSQQIASGMEYIHTRRFVHMDLAARNCLLHTGGLVKVADFGLTRPYDAGQTHYRQIGVMKLSIRWLAVDSFDHKLFSEKSDVWAFGVTMWEIFTNGTQPYTGQQLPEVLRAVRAGTRLERPPACPAEVFETMDACWHRDRARRPTFAALRAAIKGLLAKAPGELRDIGALVSSNFNDKLSRLSVRVAAGKKGAAGGPSVISEEGLTGVEDDDRH